MKKFFLSIIFIFIFLPNANATLLFYDDFNDGPAPDWGNERGDWFVSGGAYDVGNDGFDDVYGHGIPIFKASEEPSEPEVPEEPKEPEKPKDDNNSPCKLGLPMAKVFVDGTVGALNENSSLEDSMARGFIDLQKFLKRLEANQK